MFLIKKKYSCQNVLGLKEAKREMVNGKIPDVVFQFFIFSPVFKPKIIVNQNVLMDLFLFFHLI